MIIDSGWTKVAAGHRVRFVVDAEALTTSRGGVGQINVRWSPDIPRKFKNPRAQRNFLRKYREVRNAFWRRVGEETGLRTLMLEI